MHVGSLGVLTQRRLMFLDPPPIAARCTTSLKSALCVGGSVVSALCLYLQGAGQEKLGIYIKSVVKGGAADVVGSQRERCVLAETRDASDSVCAVCVRQDGRLAAGDQLLSVDGRSLVGLSQER